jgi:imidazole glycerol-phosphate synthase subunit HisH
VSVTVIGYGLGNLGSVMNMLRRIGAEPRIASTPDEIESSERLLLPGIGAFDTGMNLLRSGGLADPINDFAASGRPVLGICLGMQLLLDASEEGEERGLGLIPGASRRFDESSGLRVPHVGWNTLTPTRPDPLVAELPADSRFYFVHSYRVVPEVEVDTLAVTDYGVPFASMIRSGNVMGAQYHPEKSHAFGMQILKNFSTL